jgi:hypothetical protein
MPKGEPMSKNFDSPIETGFCGSTPEPEGVRADTEVWIDPRTKEPCRRCDGTGKVQPWPGSKGLVACGVCRAEMRSLPNPISPQEEPADEDSKYAAVIAEERQAILDEVAACLCPFELSRKDFDWAVRKFRPVEGVDHNVEWGEKYITGKSIAAPKVVDSKEEQDEDDLPKSVDPLSPQPEGKICPDCGTFIPRPPTPEHPCVGRLLRLIGEENRVDSLSPKCAEAYCKPRDRAPQWLLRYDDPEKGDCVYDSAEEAQAAFDAASMNWTVTLFAPAVNPLTKQDSLSPSEPTARTPEDM